MTLRVDCGLFLLFSEVEYLINRGYHYFFSIKCTHILKIFYTRTYIIIFLNFLCNGIYLGVWLRFSIRWILIQAIQQYTKYLYFIELLKKVTIHKTMLFYQNVYTIFDHMTSANNKESWKLVEEEVLQCKGSRHLFDI